MSNNAALHFLVRINIAAVLQAEILERWSYVSKRELSEARTSHKSQFSSSEYLGDDAIVDGCQVLDYESSTNKVPAVFR